MNELQVKWARVSSLLSAAFHELELREPSAAAQFHEFLEHNELQLAWHELVALGISNGSNAFWQHLAEAAREMHLPHEEVTATAMVTHSLKVVRFDAEPVSG